MTEIYDDAIQIQMVVLRQIRLFPTLISKIKLRRSELPFKIIYQPALKLAIVLGSFIILSKLS